MMVYNILMIVNFSKLYMFVNKLLFMLFISNIVGVVSKTSFILLKGSKYLWAVI